jgi:hypothetical protein
MDHINEASYDELLNGGNFLTSNLVATIRDEAIEAIVNCNEWITIKYKDGSILRVTL